MSKNGKSGPHCRGGSTQFAQQLEFAVIAPPLVDCVVLSLLPVIDIFFVDLKFCHVHFYTLQPYPSWSSNQSSAFKSIISSPSPCHFSSSQPTTSNDSCDMFYQFFTYPSAFHRRTTHPSNHLHLCSFKHNPTSAICDNVVAKPIVLITNSYTDTHLTVIIFFFSKLFILVNL